MPIEGYPEIEWDDDNIEHLAEHGVSPEEVDDALYGPVVRLRRRTGSPERQYVLGRTAGGRYLTIVFEWISDELIRPITAWDMSAHERRLYERQVGH